MKSLLLAALAVLLLPCGERAQEGTADEDKRCTALLDAWRKPGAVHDEPTERELFEAARRAERPEVIEEITVGTDPAKLEIKKPGKGKTVALHRLLKLEAPSEEAYAPGAPYTFVIRRMTKAHFEVWTPLHGWLLDAKGKVLGEAKPPRGNGQGRQWFGAFLPDGRWVTTDLSENDDTLTFFSREGKWLNAIPTAKLAPTQEPVGVFDLIGWARCSRDGKGWVVSVGSNEGRARVHVTPDGTTRPLEGSMESPAGDGPWQFCDEPWRLCYPRDLEAKGMYTELRRPSDDFQMLISREEPGHGPGVGFPWYSWGQPGSVTIPDGNLHFGFMPGGHCVYIGTYQTEKSAAKTWFFSETGICRGWIRGDYLTDAADGKAIWLAEGNGEVVTLGLDLKPGECMRFTLDGEGMKPVKLFPDLRLGFFAAGEKSVVLARW